MCKDNCKCNKCKNKFLPISGRDVLYYGLPLEIINVEYGENYEEILIKLNIFMIIVIVKVKKNTLCV